MVSPYLKGPVFDIHHSFVTFSFRGPYSPGLSDFPMEPTHRPSSANRSIRHLYCTFLAHRVAVPQINQSIWYPSEMPVFSLSSHSLYCVALSFPLPRVATYSSSGAIMLLYHTFLLRPMKTGLSEGADQVWPHQKIENGEVGCPVESWRAAAPPLDFT